MPQVFEKSFFGARSGSSRAALVGSLKFFDLLDQQKRPTPKLVELMRAPDEQRLAQLLRDGYPRVLELGLDSATPGQLDEALRSMGAAPSLVPKCKAFFLQAADEAGIGIGPHLRSHIGRPRNARRAGLVPKRPREASPVGDGELPGVVAALVAALPRDGEGWSQERADQWLTAIANVLPFAYGFKPDHPSGNERP